MIGKLTSAEIEQVLSQQVIGRIGCHAKGKTYVVPISYAYDGDFIYGHTQEGLKIDMMRDNPSVCFETDCFDDMANWKSVIAWGLFEEIRDAGDREHALNQLLQRNLPMISSETTHITPNWPFVPENRNEIGGIVYRIWLREKTGRYEKTAVFHEAAW
ncbi:pyridoxamine 5'-phosphate oxidase family protein [Flavihumibacter petaseus]|uniref:Pyridoxamine 5'-phosphate oxidase putative domain-containing protein n=1 Tax=Flavihumibacter petaseus NBRC 106054 TaxID=1220578 RepID=A0A0E9MU46_9BACT|nr:pyridoxamine 5'-phosphate oxidase family protein [Flavihumibacter petaseus]GAO40998.1 hypothetical protein FPE01S_01_00090 [Flavihumibacter petaseus NBRC 106054]